MVDTLGGPKETGKGGNVEKVRLEKKLVLMQTAPPYLGRRSMPIAGPMCRKGHQKAIRGKMLGGKVSRVLGGASK